MSAPAGIWGQDLADADDSTLLVHVREGSADAYAELWRRHLPAAYGVAHRHRGRTPADDIVGEASLRVYDLIRAGKGPTTNFRSYFLSTVKTVAVDFARAELRAVPTEDAGLEAVTPAAPAYDPSAGVDHDLVRSAFGRLPERDKQVLWHTAVEGTSPSVVAANLGMSANGVSVLAMRARDSLRARYLDAHADRAISRAQDDECAWVLASMGRYVRGKLPVRQRARVEEHLRGCRHAQGLAYEMAEVNRALPALMVPLIAMAGSSAATAWAWIGAAGSGGGASGQDGPKPPLEAARLVTKAAALALAALLGVGYAVGPGGIARSGAGGASATAAGAGNGSGAGTGSSQTPATSVPSSTPASTPPPATAPTAVPATPSASGAGSANTTPVSTPRSTSPRTTAPTSTSTPTTIATSTPTTTATSTPTPPPPTPVPPPTLANDTPRAATGGQPFTIGVQFGSAAGGTVAAALSPGGGLLLDCAAPGAATCTLTGSSATLGIAAKPNAYPATVVLTITNASGGTPLVVSIVLTPPPPEPSPSNPASLVGEEPAALAFTFQTASGGTVSAALQPAGSVSLSCAPSGGMSCTFSGTTGQLTVRAVPTAYPAVLRLTLTNADGGDPSIIDVPVTAPRPQFVDGLPTTTTSGTAIQVPIDLGTSAGGVVTALLDQPGQVALVGCTGSSGGCTVGSRLATVTITPTLGGSQPAARALAGSSTTARLTVTLVNAAGESATATTIVVAEAPDQPPALVGVPASITVGVPAVVGVRAGAAGQFDVLARLIDGHDATVSLAECPSDPAREVGCRLAAGTDAVTVIVAGRPGRKARVVLSVVNAAGLRAAATVQVVAPG